MMNTQKGFATPQISNEELIQHLETCALCGERLLFSHKTDYLTLAVYEETTCSCCGIKNKASDFILQ